MYVSFIKRFLDFVLSLLGLLILIPLLAVVAVLVRWLLGSPVLFRQERPGLHGVPFTIFKFRTMRHARGPLGEMLPDSQRLTRFGSALRTVSLDELPELFNVLIGDMSLVGPRPLLKEYLERYTPAQARRHEVRPGITGWAQVNGRNALSWEQKFEYDVWYVDHVSVGLDFRILARTVANVLKREGITREGHPTTPRFQGSRPDSVEREG